MRTLIEHFDSSYRLHFFAIAFLFCLLLPGIGNAQCPPAPVIHTGEATFYTFANGAGSCMFDPTPHDLMVGAMNDLDYGNSQVCGECVSLTGPSGTILIRIVDRCPECLQGDIDLSPLAFSFIADTILGRVPITWQVISCAVTGPIQYHFKDGSNQWWTAVQIRNHANPILSLEYLTSQGTYRSVNRVEFNYFIDTAGMGPGPYTFRVTDVYGHVLTDSGIPHIENGTVPGQSQFPPCNALPVQLVSFTATVLAQDKVRLNWTTLTEINNYGFEVQRSDTSGRHYQTIPNSFIPGHGTTNEPQHYSYVDSTVSGSAWYYRLKQMDLDGHIVYSDGIRVDILTGVKEKEIPTEFSLGQNFPNPFNPSTRIHYELPKDGLVLLVVYDILGREVATLVSEHQQPGRYDVGFNTAGLAGGVYFYRLIAGNFVSMKKMVLMK